MLEHFEPKFVQGIHGASGLSCSSVDFHIGISRIIRGLNTYDAP